MGLGLLSRFPARHLKVWRQQDLPGSWMTLSRICPALGPRPGRRIRPVRHVDAAPASVTTKAPAQYRLSRLNCMASAIATYASPPQVAPGRARLASGCRPWLCQVGVAPTGSFRTVSGLYIILPPSPGFAWRNTEFDNISSPDIAVLYWPQRSVLVQPASHHNEPIAAGSRRNTRCSSSRASLS